MRGPLLIYGATGFTGRLVAERARALGMNAMLAGRSAERLRPLAERLGLAWRIARLDQPSSLDAMLQDIEVVLHVAGPYVETARPMVEACLRSKTHYLDLAGELPVFLDLQRLDATARERGLMLMPGAGFVVAASDCLAAHLAERMPNARSLRLAFSRTDLISRGTLRAMLGLVREAVSIRRDGELTSVPVGRLQRRFDFGAGERPSTALSWADVVTAYHTTAIPTIEVYAEAEATARLLYQAGAWLAGPLQRPAARAVLRSQTRLWPDGPPESRRSAARRVIVGEVEDPWRQIVRARLHTPDGYSITPAIALEIARRVLSDDLEPGFQTPAGIYGPGLVFNLDGVRLETLRAGPVRDLAPRHG
jgi:saccharopine dehydrogenase (NAD+, L-lysine-forming)